MAGGLISVFCGNYGFDERIFCCSLQAYGILRKTGSIQANCHFRDKLRVSFFTEEFLITCKTLIAGLYFVFFLQQKLLYIGLLGYKYQAGININKYK